MSYNLLDTFKFVLKSNTNHYLAVHSSVYEKWHLIIKILVLLNPYYKSCTIYRKKYKEYENIVVIGLKYNGKKIKRRTNGFAKKFIQEHPDAKCLYCTNNLTEQNATTDHIVPISHGGNNAQVNLVVVCTACNQERGNMDFYKFKNKKNPNSNKYF